MFRSSSETMVCVAVCHCEEGMDSRAAYPAARSMSAPAGFGFNRVHSASINGLSDHMLCVFGFCDNPCRKSGFHFCGMVVVGTVRGHRS